MSFRAVFIAVLIGTALVAAAFLLNAARPRAVTDQPSAALVRAAGRCAECHRNQHYAVVHEYELSVHATKHVSCLECHQPVTSQKGKPHHGFEITEKVTAANCRTCHERVYQQFVRSRHAAPSWAAVYGEKDFTREQLDFAEKFHPGSCRRPPNALIAQEGGLATEGGCVKCHSVGKPNPDGTIGTCTACHTRHSASVEVARLPQTCGQCHMGPDHSQLEIYMESRHGVLFQAQHRQLKLGVPSRELTTRDMFIPTCATCHMSGLNGLNITHDPSERLSYLLAAEISPKRPNYALAQANMKDVCLNCHTKGVIERVYTEAERLVETTNQKVQQAKAIVEGLRKEGLLSGKPFERPLDFHYFDLWHYHGRTVKHGAFMGGADFVQWHGNYPLLKSTVELKALAEELRRAHGKGGKAHDR